MNDATVQREFKGIWIPRELWLNTSLSPAEKCLLAEVDSFTHEGGECFASNKYLSKFMHMTEGSLKNMMVRLRKDGYIIDVRFDGRKRFIRADFTPELRQGSSDNDGSSHSAMHIDKSIEQREKEEDLPDSLPLPSPSPPPPYAPPPPPQADVQNCTPAPDAPTPPPGCPSTLPNPPAPRTGDPRKPSKARETWLTPFDNAWFARTGGHLPFAQVSRGFKQFIADHGDEALPWWESYCWRAPKDEYHTVYSFLRNPIPWKPETNGIAATKEW